MILTRPYKEFFNSEEGGGLILVFVTVFSLVIAISDWQVDYINFWNFDLGGHNITHWINDGLMTIFFLLIGLAFDILLASLIAWTIGFIAFKMTLRTQVET